MPDLDVSVDGAVAARFPDYRGAVVIASGLLNGPSDEASDALLEHAGEALRRRGLGRAADDPHLAAWRATFSRFGAKPSKYPSSAEALASRILKGGQLPRINALVDMSSAWRPDRVDGDRRSGRAVPHVRGQFVEHSVECGLI